MLVSDLLAILDSLAPFALAEEGDNCGLLVGDEGAPVRRVLSSLELTETVLEEAVSGGFDTVLTHHPLLFSPIRSLVESRLRERLLRRLVEGRITLIACHTNLDSAPGGLADIAAEALGLQQTTPLQSASAGRLKLVGFVPPDAVERVAEAAFAAGAGTIGLYDGCAFAGEGTGWFTPQKGSRPSVGGQLQRERIPEVRWETVVPRGRLAAVIRAYVQAHPYEEPAFDIYPVEDVLRNAGLGRVGLLDAPLSVRALAERAVEIFGLSGASWSGDGAHEVRRIGVLPGSGRSLLEAAQGQCEVLLTGDVGYHSGDLAAERGLALIDLPHGEFEWWAFRHWTEGLAKTLTSEDIALAISRSWKSPWEATRCGDGGRDAGGVSVGEREELVTRRGAGATVDRVRIWIDGGSRGNPGPSAIGVVIEDAQGVVLDTVSRVIGNATNNVAEYRALLAALERAERMGAEEVEVASDSELLVKQMRGEYRVKNEGLVPLHAEARARAAGLGRFAIRHVPREENTRADGLVNQALDEDKRTSL